MLYDHISVISGMYMFRPRMLELRNESAISKKITPRIHDNLINKTVGKWDAYSLRIDAKDEYRDLLEFYVILVPGVR